MQSMTRQVVDKKSKRQRYRHLKKLKRASGMNVYYVSNGDTGRVFWTKYSVIGERRHFVTRYLGEDFRGKYQCDCGNGTSPCSHVIAVKLFRGEKA